jgi:hypothetical protein
MGRHSLGDTGSVIGGRSQMTGRPTMSVLVGLPAAGKTTRARQIEAEHPALRLTLDEWMVPLFGVPDAGGKQDVLEGRLVWLAIHAFESVSA